MTQSTTLERESKRSHIRKLRRASKKIRLNMSSKRNAREAFFSYPRPASNKTREDRIRAVPEPPQAIHNHSFLVLRNRASKATEDPRGLVLRRSKAHHLRRVPGPARHVNREASEDTTSTSRSPESLPSLSTAPRNQENHLLICLIHRPNHKVEAHSTCHARRSQCCPQTRNA